MRRLFLILIAISTVFPVCAQSYDFSALKSFPSYGQVMNHALQEYGSDTLGNIGFARRPDGWYLRRLDGQYQLHGEFLIWSGKTATYVDIDLQHAGFGPAEPSFPGNTAYYKRMFRINPFWGYEGWFRDVIRLVGAAERKGNIDDSMLYGLARAYGEYKQSLVRAQFEFSVSMFPDARYEKLGPERVELIRAYTDSTLAAYEKLTDQNPQFMTILGTIQVKLANMYMDAWYTFTSIREPGLAEKYLRDGIYPPSLLAYAKNTLDNCERGAILFTNGDNDTYPLWYAQQKLGYRKDVQVINLSLLNMPSYIDMVLEQLPANRFSILASDSTWYRYSFAYIGSSPDTTLDLKTLLQVSLRSDSVPTLLVVDNEAILQGYNQNGIELSFNSSYIIRGQLAMLYIIGSAKEAVPVSFAITVAESQSALFSSYMRNDGMVRSIDGYIRPENTEGQGYLDPDRLFMYLFTKFDGSTVAGNEKLGLSNINLSYRRMFANLAGVLAREKDAERFEVVANKYFDIFSGDEFIAEVSELLIAQGYYDLEQQKEGSKLLRTSVEEMIVRAGELRHYTAANDPDLDQVVWELRNLDKLIETGISMFVQQGEHTRADNFRSMWEATKH